MEKHLLKATKRTMIGRKVKRLRKEGILPANIYGKKVKSLSIQVSEKEFTLVFGKAGETGIVELTVDGEEHPVLIHSVTYNPVTSRPYHVDFYQVDLKEKVTAKVPLVMVGDSPAVKDKLGVLLHILSEIEVESLPSDLPDKVEIDVSSMKAINETVKVNQIKVSDKVKILTDPNLDIVKVVPLVSKEAQNLAAEEAAAAATAAVSTEAPVEKGEAKVATSEPSSSKEPTPEAKQQP